MGKGARQTDQLSLRRLKILTINFDLHMLMNGQAEHEATTKSMTDFWACMKVRGWGEGEGRVLTDVVVSRLTTTAMRRR